MTQACSCLLKMTATASAHNIDLRQQAAAFLKAERELDEQFGIPSHVTLTEGVKYIRETTGFDLGPKLLTSPLMDDIPKVDVFLEVADICKRRGLPVNALNPIIAKHGWQTKLGQGHWDASDRAQQMGFCKRHTWSRGGKSGVNWKWRLSFAEDLLKSEGIL